MFTSTGLEAMYRTLGYSVYEVDLCDSSALETWYLKEICNRKPGLSLDCFGLLGRIMGQYTES